MKNTPADRSKAFPAEPLLGPRFAAILCAARRLWEAGEYITRSSLIAATGMTEPICDSTLRAMVDQGLINRSIKGVYQLPEYANTELRAVSATWIPNYGGLKLEIGDQCISLRLEEARLSALALHGAVMAQEMYKKHTPSGGN